MPITLTLGLTGLVIALATAIPLGVLAAMREGSALDRAIGLLALLGQAMPSFWLALMLIIWFGAEAATGCRSRGWMTWQGYILPGIVLAFSAIPALLRLTRAGMIDALRADYIRTARAKGLSLATDRAEARAAQRGDAGGLGRRRAAWLHAGRLDRDRGDVRVHGVGYLAWESISKGDFPVVQAVVLLLALIYIVLTLLADR